MNPIWYSPDYAALDTIWCHPSPFVLWPVGNQPLLAHWLDAAVRTGTDGIIIQTLDRPSTLREFLDSSGYWSRKVEIVSLKNPPTDMTSMEIIDRLPWQETTSIQHPTTPDELLIYWFSLQKEWLQSKNNKVINIEKEIQPSCWVGPASMIDPGAKLIPPVWISKNVKIGPQCQIGPNAFISEGCVVDQNVIIREAFLANDTYAGKNTALEEKIAQGGLLLDLKRGNRVEINERFILDHLSSTRNSPGFIQRIVALFIYILLFPLSLFYYKKPRRVIDYSQDGTTLIALEEIKECPLLMSRLNWLKHVITGKLFWIGILPRNKVDLEFFPAEVKPHILSSRTGIFSLSDTQGIHSSGNEEEWIHALYQAMEADPNLDRMIISKIPTLLFKRI